MRPLAKAEKNELRRMTDSLVSCGYGEREAARLIWDGFCGGMAGARAVATVLADVPTVGSRDIVF